MTRMLLPASVALLLAGEPAMALEATSTMADWATASDDDRNAFLDSLGPSLSRTFQADKTAILACLDRAGESSAHAELPVTAIAKACAEEARPDHGSGQGNDI